MNKRIKTVLAFILIISITSMPAYAGEGFSIRLIGNETYDIDKPLTLHATVTDYVYANPTSAIEFTVNFDPIYLTYDHFTVSQAVYESVYASSSVISPNEIKFMVAFLGSDNALETTKEIIDIHFTPSKKGSTTVSMRDAYAATYKGDLFEPNIVDATIRIYDSYDVNKDGVINLVDVAMTSYHIGKSAAEYPQYDLDGDNDIDRHDVELIMNFLMNK